jgi:hypothetical protein
VSHLRSSLYVLNLWTWEFMDFKLVVCNIF